MQVHIIIFLLLCRIFLETQSLFLKRTDGNSSILEIQPLSKQTIAKVKKLKQCCFAAELFSLT